jgi:hypothetical protein
MIALEPSKYDSDPVVLLALSPGPIRYTTRASSYQALRGQNMVACPGLHAQNSPSRGRVSVLGGNTSNAASEGCHSIAQLIIMMSDLQTPLRLGDDILQMTVHRSP